MKTNIVIAALLGYVAAIKAAQLGIKTAIIEKENNLGGTCLNVGCIPSKALLSSSELYQQAKHHFKNHGIHSEGLSIDVEAMMKRKEGVIRKMARGIDYLIKKNNIEHFSGTGRIINSSEVEVDQGKQKKNLKTKRILIATGSRVSGLPFLDFDGNTVLSSDHAISAGAGSGGKLPHVSCLGDSIAEALSWKSSSCVCG